MAVFRVILAIEYNNGFKPNMPEMMQVEQNPQHIQSFRPSQYDYFASSEYQTPQNRNYNLSPSKPANIKFSARNDVQRGTVHSIPKPKPKQDDYEVMTMNIVYDSEDKSEFFFQGCIK